MSSPAAPRRAGLGLCLLVCALLILLAVRHVQALTMLAPLSFGIQVRDVVLFAVLVALLAGACAALVRAQRRGLSRRALGSLGGGVVLLLALLVLAGDPEKVGYGEIGFSGGGFSGAYSSQLFLDFAPTLPWEGAAVLIALLGLLPVAAVSAAAARGGRIAVTSRRRVAVLSVCAVAALLLLFHLERSVALLDLLRGRTQELGEAAAVTWVALLWALLAVGWSALAVHRAAATLARLAVLVPLGVLLGAGLLLLDERGRHECCFAYAFFGEVPRTFVEPQDGVASVQDWYGVPPIGPDLLVLAGSLAVGVALPVTLRWIQLRRVSTSASTPPG